MTSRGRDEAYPNGPGFVPGSSTLLAMSNTMISRGDILPTRARTESPTVGARPSEMQHSLSSPPSVKGMKTRQALEGLMAENSRLKVEVASLSEKLGRMVTDHVKTRKELSNARLAQGDTQNSAELQQTVDQLTTELRKKDLDLREKDQSLREQEFELRDAKSQLVREQENRGRDVTEIQKLQNMANNQQSTHPRRDTSHDEIQRLQNELQDLRASHASQDTSRSVIEQERAKTQQYRQELDQQRHKFSQLRAHTTAGEAKIKSLTQSLRDLQELHQRTVDEARDKLQARENIERSHASEMAEAQRLTMFFKKNSEATARRAKELEMEIQNLKLLSLPSRPSQQPQSSQRNVWEYQDNGSSPVHQGTPGAWPVVGRGM